MIYDTFNLTMAAATVAVACGGAYVVFKTIQAERRHKRFKAASRAALQGCVPNNIYSSLVSTEEATVGGVKVTLWLQVRRDGGIHVFSLAPRGLQLSHKDGAAVLRDLGPAIGVLASQNMREAA